MVGQRVTRRLKPGFIVTAAACLLVACSSGGGREIQIVATNDGCTPITIAAATNEKLTFVVKNQASGDRELEGVEGTKLEEVLIPSGRTRKINHTTPKEATTEKLKCYIPGGPATIIDLKISAP
jgi:hypothetical protein